MVSSPHFLSLFPSQRTTRLPHCQTPKRSSLTNTISHLSQASTNYKEAFALFDKRGNGRVALQSLGDLLRACGQNPTLAEIRDLEASVGGDCMSISNFFLAVSRRGGDEKRGLDDLKKGREEEGGTNENVNERV